MMNLHFISNLNMLHERAAHVQTLLPDRSNGKPESED
jgi:hypothetical protein